ncbi:serine O-acetyltransferase EpsC [Oscillatoria sp. FACHB-1406]|uniref:serine O-acetyltransferase EpsC n=1 Tax=Oscillatoria sp. FACHB-1406 TaxID=2692846 RepID=UPI001686839C|nr:serine O-acetyltransferase EpsC [Oscillatoria sp. FACHB-1406]MBD2577781.1 serine acetyltransferase [Oscillatoria sp. FACHB-1406]
MFELFLYFPTPTRVLSHPSKVNARSSLLSLLQQDFATLYQSVPTASQRLEIFFCHPGLHALTLHRLAHWLHQRGVTFFPRLLSHLGRCFTGIEIHPGATIGSGLVIESGMGVVIGETTIIGDNCWIESEVTLGGTGKESGKRHPTLGNGVVVGTGAKVLGNIRLGDRAYITAGAIVLRDVPSDCTVAGIPGRIVADKNGRRCDAEGNLQPLLARIEQLERRIRTLKQHQTQSDAQSEVQFVAQPSQFADELELCRMDSKPHTRSTFQGLS